MDNMERTAAINIGGEEYTLVLTTRATKQIAGRYGGLENLGDKLMKSENFEMPSTRSSGSSRSWQISPFRSTISVIMIPPGNC